jgi:hypothetical protein
LSPAEGPIIANGNSTAVEVTSRLQALVKDTDKDSTPDQTELCVGELAQREECVKTDPAKRDTDNDGWWDGIESAFYKK